jgi:hypothetical protein
VWYDYKARNRVEFWWKDAKNCRFCDIPAKIVETSPDVIEVLNPPAEKIDYQRLRKWLKETNPKQRRNGTLGSIGKTTRASHIAMSASAKKRHPWGYRVMRKSAGIRVFWLDTKISRLVPKGTTWKDVPPGAYIYNQRTKFVFEMTPWWNKRVPWMVKIRTTSGAYGFNDIRGEDEWFYPEIIPLCGGIADLLLFGGENGYKTRHKHGFPISLWPKKGNECQTLNSILTEKGGGATAS